MKHQKPPITLLTGGTGFLGSHIGAELLRKGEEALFLVRGNRNATAAARLENILDWHGVDRTLRTKARLIEGELSDHTLGMAPEKRLRIDRIIHCASDTSFSERNRERIWAANVAGVSALIDFAIQNRILSFIHISTAYVAGRRTGACPEEQANSNGFFNVYEESKAAAEQILLRRFKDEGIRLTILRPSIVYGDSRTGRTFRFNALYYPVKTALFLKKTFEKDIRERGGEKASEVGVAIEQDGRTRLPLRIDVGTDCGVNLIPVDYFVDAFFAIIDNSLNGGIYHIVNPAQTRITDIIDYARDQFQLKGVRSCSPEEFLKKPRNLLEMLFERYLDAYSPYIKDTRIFLTTKTNPILLHCGIVCPEFDKNMFRRCMSYAIAANWGGFMGSGSIGL